MAGEETGLEGLFGNIADTADIGAVAGSNAGMFPPTELFEEIIEAGAHADEDDAEHRFPGYHPSQISSKSCVRFYVLSSLPDVLLKKDFDYKTLQIFAIGNSVHSRLQKYMSKHLLGSWKCEGCHKITNQRTKFIEKVTKLKSVSEVLKDKLAKKTLSHSYTPIHKPDFCRECQGTDFTYAEWKVVSDSGIMGSIDGILNIEGFPLGGLEVKSVVSHLWRNLNRTTPFVEKYLRQFGIYLQELGLDWGVVVFENKDTPERKYLFVRRDEIDLEGIYASIEKANRYKKEKKLPPAKRCDDCKDCAFYRTEYCKPK